MLLKPGVDISRLKPPIRKKLNKIDHSFSFTAKTEMVVTSTYEGTHSPGSLHYAHLAIDLKLPDPLFNLPDVLRYKLGRDYDVVEEVDHLHIEYDPKGS